MLAPPQLSALPRGAPGALGTARPHWTLRLLGGFSLHCGQRRLDRLPGRAVELLLARLALAPQRSHPREELVDLLWPDAPPGTGRNRLRYTLSTLKAAIEDPASGTLVLADRDSVRLQAERIDCDVLHFEQALRTGDAETARGWYRGDLLPGCYDEWVNDERRRLSALAEQLAHIPALPRDAGAGAARLQPPSNGLPRYWTRLFGADANIARLQALVQHERLVTLCGPGGSGKTRLAAETARGLADAGPRLAAFDQVAFVALADCHNPGHVLQALAELFQQRGQDPLQQLVDTLAAQRLLLVLDNVEQVQGPLPALLATLLSRLPQLHLLVTSRRRLSMDGEHLFDLRGLECQGPPGDTGTTGTTRSTALPPALALFADRARSVRPGLVLDTDAVAAMGDLVQQLAGLPLAIELAASRVRHHLPHALLQQLRAGTPWLGLLQGANVAAEPRHASMRGVLQWSWQDLTPDLRSLMAALASLDSPARAPALAAMLQTDETSTQQRLDQLSDLSLAQAETDARGQARYRLLPPVREYVRETATDKLDPARDRRLAQWLAAQARAVDPGQLGALLPEMPLALAAIDGAVADERDADALAIACAWWPLWMSLLRPLPLAVTERLEQVALRTPEVAVASELRSLLAFCRQWLGCLPEAAAHADLALQLACNDAQRCIALLRQTQARMALLGFSASTDAAAADMLALAQCSGQPRLQALAFHFAAVYAINAHEDFDQADAHGARAQALYEQLGDHRAAFAALRLRAHTWAWRGRNEEALTVLASCEWAAERFDDANGHALVTWQRGRILMRLRRPDEAMAALRRSLQTAVEHHHPMNMMYALLQIPQVMCALNRAEDAARLQAWVQAQWQARFGRFTRVQERERTRTRRLLRLALGPVRLEALGLQGRSMTQAEALALAAGRLSAT